MSDDLRTISDKDVPRKSSSKKVKKPRGPTFLISPVALQNVLTQACRSGKEGSSNGEVVPASITMQMNQAKTSIMLSPPNSTSADSGLHHYHHHPPPSSSSSSIHHAVLLSSDGVLLMQSEGLDAESAAYMSGLVANMWKIQLGAAAGADPTPARDAARVLAGNAPKEEKLKKKKKMERSLGGGGEMDREEEETSDDEEAEAIRVANDKISMMGVLDYMLMVHKDKIIAIAPSSYYLVCLIADKQVQVGMLKNRVLCLAKRLQDVLKNVTPKPFR